MERDQVQLGVAVTLHDPMKPSTPSQMLIYALESGEMMHGLEYRNWKGFTHGIILYTEDEKRMLYLLLYDPSHHILYCDDVRRIPVLTLFHYDEVDFLKEAGDFTQ